MFCTHCGTKIDEGKKFCKNCGASTSKAVDPVSTAPAPEFKSIPVAKPVETPPRPRPAQVSTPQPRPMPLSPSRESRGINKSVIVGAGIVVIAAAGAGIYFGTGLLRSPVKQVTLAVEAPAAKAPESFPVPPIEETKATSESKDSNLNSPLWSVSPEPQQPAAVETPNLNPETAPKRRAKNDLATQTRKAPSQPAVQDPPAPTRTTRAPAPAIASQRPASPGTYETIRPTSVFEAPSASSRVVSNIGPGIKVNVVGSNGDWLEVRSRLGNPPGFIRRDDASLVQRTD